MKKFLLSGLPLPAIALAALLLPAVSARAQTPKSPVGAWDCSLSGHQLGLALLNFHPDFTLDGVQYMRPTAGKSSSPSLDPRHPTGEPTRSGVEPPPTPVDPGTNFVGSTTISGIWGYDEKGKTIGLLDQVTAAIQLVQKNVTNTVVSSSNVNGVPVFTTNDVVTTTNVYEVVLNTNAVSFRATVVPEKRITLVAYLPNNAKNIYTGTPVQSLADISGDYLATGKRAGLPFVEFLNLMPNPEIAGEYIVTGTGAGYGFSGFALPSKRNQIAIYMQTDREPYPITVYSGGFSLTTRRGTLNGRDTDDLRYTYRIFPQ